MCGNLIGETWKKVIKWILFLYAGQTNPLYGPLVEKQIVYDTGKTLILLVWFLPSLCSGIKLHTRKFFFSHVLFSSDKKIALSTCSKQRKDREQLINFRWISANTALENISFENILTIFNTFDFNFHNSFVKWCFLNNCGRIS